MKMRMGELMLSSNAASSCPTFWCRSCSVSTAPSLLEMKCIFFVEVMELGTACCSQVKAHSLEDYKYIHDLPLLQRGEEV